MMPLRRAFTVPLVATALAAAAACSDRPLLQANSVVNGGTGATQTGGSSGAASRGDGGVESAVAPGPLCPALAEPAAAAPSDPTPVPAGCSCTRRPGPGTSYQCPVGVGQSIAATIGPDGGTITLNGQQAQSSGVPFKIDFPPGALAQPTVVTVTETTIPPPKDLLDYSPVYRVDPQGTALAVAAKLQIPWGALSGTTVYGLATYALTDPTTDGGCTFNRVGDSYTNAGFEQSSLLRFGYFFVGAARTAATAACP